MTAFRAFLVAAFAALLLSGCATDDYVQGGYIDGPDHGRKVWCVTSGYGVDCDWQSYHRGDK